MSEHTRRVLELVAQGKITPAEGAELLDAMKESPANGAPPPSGEGRTERPREERPRYMRIAVHKTGRDGRPPQDVNIRVPLTILRSGIRLGAIIPGLARERMQAKLRERGVDIDLATIDPAQIESLLRDMGEVNIDVNEGAETVRISCE